MGYKARVIGVGRPPPTVRVTGVIPPGRFSGGDDVLLDGVTAERVDFSRLRFQYIATQGSTFVDCDFSQMRIESGSFDAARTSVFVRCRFDGFQPGATLFGVSRFEGCNFEDMRLKDWWVAAAEFIDCRFSGRFDGILLHGVPPPPHDRRERMIPWRTRNEFRGNDLSRADLRFPDFRYGVNLAANTWPAGPDYLYLERWQERLDRALAEVARWPDDAEREQALWWLRSERSHGREQQQQMLVRTADWVIEPHAMWPKLWASLAAGLR